MTGPIGTLLVANRGEIARRIFRTARSMGMRCVALYVDADAGAPFVREADEAVRLSTGYLDRAAIVEIARTLGAAVHPGYGFLSEDAAFAAEVIDAGLVWVGPPPEAIEAMGDKLAAKKVATAADVPVLPSVDDPSLAGDVGFPLLVKAAAGGGGKGMHVVDSPAELVEAVATARREAASAFGDDRVFLERYVRRSRHVEIQILADSAGGLVHLGERECSIQRRHQKIIEESPSPLLDYGMRAAMADAALRLGQAIGYQSVGTVEFLVDHDSRDFFFLEMNTRLQVEHPVTEEVTGIDLVREQLRVASGDHLGYTQDHVTFTGHAIEVRLYAEDADAGFLPATGALAAFTPAASPAVRWESGVETGSVVGVRFDPMLAKVVAHAPTRTEAAARLALALERLHVGGVATNRDFLVATLRHPAYLKGDTTTDFIDRVRPATAVRLDDGEVERVAIIAALWLQGSHRAEAQVLAEMPSSWRNARLPDPHVEFTYRDRTVDVSYRCQRDGTFALRNGAVAQVHHWWPGGTDVEIDGRRSSHAVTRAGHRLHVQTARGTVDLDLVPRFAPPGCPGVEGGFLAPMPGVVVEVRCTVGDHIAAGQTVVVLEAMKMEQHIRAPADGVIAEVRVTPGQQVEHGAVLLVFAAAGEATSD